MQAATNAERRSWGEYVGNRYASFDNIVWNIGGDTDPTPVRAKVREVVDGIRQNDTRHIMKTHSSSESYPVTSWPGESWVAINSVYSYMDPIYEELLGRLRIFDRRRVEELSGPRLERVGVAGHGRELRECHERCRLRSLRRNPRNRSRGDRA